MIIEHKIKDPIAPDIVLFGLIFVSLGPLKIFPKIKPPISDPIHPNNIINNNIFNWLKFEKMKNKYEKRKI